VTAQEQKLQDARNQLGAMVVKGTKEAFMDPQSGRGAVLRAQSAITQILATGKVRDNNPFREVRRGVNFIRVQPPPGVRQLPNGRTVTARLCNGIPCELLDYPAPAREVIRRIAVVPKTITSDLSTSVMRELKAEDKNPALRVQLQSSQQQTARNCNGRPCELLGLPVEALPPVRTLPPKPRPPPPSVLVRPDQKVILTPVDPAKAPVDQYSTDSKGQPIPKVINLTLANLYPGWTIQQGQKLETPSTDRGPLGRKLDPKQYQHIAVKPSTPLGRKNFDAPDGVPSVWVDSLNTTGRTPLGRLYVAPNDTQSARARQLLKNENYVVPAWKDMPTGPTFPWPGDENFTDPYSATGRLPTKDSRIVTSMPGSPVGRLPTSYNRTAEYIIEMEKKREELKKLDPNDVEPNEAVRWTSLDKVLKMAEDAWKKVDESQLADSSVGVVLVLFVAPIELMDGLDAVWLDRLQEGHPHSQDVQGQRELYAEQCFEPS